MPVHGLGKGSIPKREAPPFFTIGIIIVIIGAGVLGLYVYTNYDSLFGLNQTTTYPLANPINTINSSLSVDTVLQNYQKNPVSANATYTGKAAFVTGYVTNLFEPKAGTYESCYNPNSFPAFSCADSNSNSGFVIWYWNGKGNAGKVTSGTTVTVECLISGYSGGNLTLSYCSFTE
jgi:tRNA_anti-like